MSPESVSLTISQHRSDRPYDPSLVLGLDGRFRQDDVGLEFLSQLICHDLERAFCLRFVKRQAELVKAMTPQNLACDLRLCLLCERRFLFLCWGEILVFILTLLLP